MEKNKMKTWDVTVKKYRGIVVEAMTSEKALEKAREIKEVGEIVLAAREINPE